MPPRFAYWTIILDGVATSFRAHDRDEILPTFNQLKKKDPAALLKWFSGGKLWDSPEQAKELRALERVRTFREERKKEASEPHGDHGPAQGPERGDREDPLAEFRRQHGRPADGSDDPSLRGGGGVAPRAGGPGGRPERPAGADRAGGPDRREFRGAPPRGPRRDRDWRPGGEHKDPRDKYKLPPGEARKRWKERNLGPRVPKPFGSKPGGDRPFGDRPRGPKPFGSKPGGDRPFGDRPRGPKPFGSKPGSDRPFRGKPSGPGGPRPFGRKPSGPRKFGPKVGGQRPFAGKPRGPGRRGPK